MSSLNYQAALGAMRLIKDGASAGLHSAFGISPEDFRLFTASVPWTAADRYTVKRCLDEAIYGTLDVIGLPRFSLPAEYAAGVVTVFVAPINRMVACRWLEGTDSDKSVADLAGGAPDPEIFDSRQLFGLCVELADDPMGGQARAAYERRTGLEFMHDWQGDEEA